MIGRWTKGLLHLLVGGACAALVAWLTFGFSMTIVNTQGPVRLVMAALVVLAGVIVAALLLASPVRAAEVGLASTLLEVPLAAPADQSSWESRRRGLLWAVLVILLGGASLLALLWCVPQGLWMLVAAVDDGVAGSLPELLRSVPGIGLGAMGLGLVLVGIFGQVALVALLRWLAPRVLGPTSTDRLLRAEEEHARLLRSHELARELHDSIGHALTAIGVQAEAGSRVAAHDPAFAQRALEQIAETTRSAVSELDGVLGSLRRGADPPPSAAEDGRRAPDAVQALPGLGSVIALLGDLGPRGQGTISCQEASGEVDEGAAHTAYRVVQEALTNLHRHGTGEGRGQVRVENGQIMILLENPVRSAATARSGGHGLVGMRERLALAGGSLAAGPVSLDGQAWWRLEATLPARSSR
ncbi:sensor histidine kinase [Ornithinimicrobium murale]|uniref:sensor histidine kinase n=1 Tax=Ornithinimicrobium murale TaxID=1050153 RepID=UPI0013B39DD3|nr:histidine kinase [Ornithinimicrobium murale]